MQMLWRGGGKKKEGVGRAGTSSKLQEGDKQFFSFFSQLIVYLGHIEVCLHATKTRGFFMRVKVACSPRTNEGGRRSEKNKIKSDPQSKSSEVRADST